VVVDETFVANEDTPISGNVLSNDSDVDEDQLMARLLIPPSHGMLTLKEDGSFEYLPEANFNGIDSFIYEVSDGTVTEMATATLTIKSVNDAPVAKSDAFTTDEDAFASGNVLTNDSDVDRNALMTSLVTNADNGTITLHKNGSFEYRPNENFNGSDSFTYSVSDGELSDTATVALTVRPVNDAPIAKDDIFVTNEDTAVSGNVLANDSDAEGNTLTARLLIPPANGTVILKEDGRFEYVPKANFTGEDSFLYEVRDGIATDMETVTLMVQPVNDAPIATNDTFVTNEDASVSGNLLKNDRDVDSEPLTASLAASAANGVVTVNGDGSFEYTPKDNFNGTDSFMYKVSDGDLSELATVNIAVLPSNDAPIAADDQATVQENTAAVLNVLSNDVDIDGDALTTSLAAAPLNGTVVFSDGDAAFVYTPGKDFVGGDRFTYEISDGQLTDTATVTLTVEASAPISKAPAGFFDYQQMLHFQDPDALVPTDTIDGLPIVQFFDEAYYLGQNPDVADAIENGIVKSGYQHFIQFGLKEGRSPSVLFDGDFYLGQNSDVADAVENGLLSSGLEHFLLYGHEEGRDPSDLFDQSDYLTDNPDVAAAVEAGALQSAFEHYIVYGIDEGRLSLPLLFDEGSYLRNNPDVATAVEKGVISDGFEHFVQFGQREGRLPSSLYNEGTYLYLNPDVHAAVAAETFASGFHHYATYGQFEGRTAV
jgi:VCBS repeat-containing protein